jgi:hypothetical protein
MKSISIDIQQGDILEFEADVLVLKYAQAHYGVAAAIADLFEGAGQPLRFPAPMRGVRLVRSVGGITAEYVLFVGVPPLREFGYSEIREFARNALSALAGKTPEAQHIALTLHGPGYGLDEIEAFEFEVAGLLDAVQAGDLPESLTAITFVERNHGRAQRLAEALSELLPAGRLYGDRHNLQRSSETLQRLSAVGNASEAKAHVFVAMPFKDEMDDVYHYGIQRAVRAAGFSCERADLSTFTGDVLDWVRKRIESALFVVADLTEANPNVYLEVGYAWGTGVTTVLVVRDTAHLKFDVRGQRCLVYKKIKDLEEQLSAELQNLSKNGG